jgi:hypothetical protein
MELKQALEQELAVLPTCEHYRQLLPLVGTSDEARKRVGLWTYKEWKMFINENFEQKS